MLLILTTKRTCQALSATQPLESTTTCIPQFNSGMTSILTNVLTRAHTPYKHCTLCHRAICHNCSIHRPKEPRCHIASGKVTGNLAFKFPWEKIRVLVASRCRCHTNILEQLSANASMYLSSGTNCSMNVVSCTDTPMHFEKVDKQILLHQNNLANFLINE